MCVKNVQLQLLASWKIIWHLCCLSTHKYKKLSISHGYNSWQLAGRATLAFHLLQDQIRKYDVCNEPAHSELLYPFL
jgi:hypothetical protein